MSIFITSCIFSLPLLYPKIQSSFGTFQSYYDTHPPFDQASPTAIASIGTTALALEYGAGIVLMAIFQNHPQHLRILMHFGLMLWLVGIVGASFATKVCQS